ncbi:MAG TPA: hypothetical protein VEY67_12625 [Candidatus Dormibacteraeota bacterium]|nr:hypothetical protein [Candidatus Dormibacteraeota bacterium]
MDATFDQPRELRAITFTHEYAFPMRRLAWWTLAIAAVMGALYFLVGFPPAFDTYYEKMYFHAIGIGLAALAAYLVLDAFDLETYEPPVDFPIRYRAFIAVAFAALGGLVFIDRDVFAALPDVGVLLFVIAFVLAFDVTGALLVELFVMPRKRAGIYESRSRTLFDYVSRLIPFSAADRATYSGLGSAYWLTVVSLLSALFAELIGFVNLWVRAFGPSVFGGLINALGLDASGFQDATLDPHSHMVAIAIIALVVALAVTRFGILRSESPLRRALARAGTWIAIVGVIGTSLVLGAVAFLGFAPPTVFASGPDGVNGMAGDDLVMTIVFLGAMVVAVALLAEPAVRRSGLRVTIVGSWIAMVAITVLEGFYIELNHVDFGQGGSLASNDAAFSAAHPMTGLFLMTILSVALLLVDFYGVAGFARRVTIAVGALGLIAAAVGTTLWTFVDPSQNGAVFALYVAGIAVSYLAVLLAAMAVRTAHTRGYERTAGADPARP